LIRTPVLTGLLAVLLGPVAGVAAAPVEPADEGMSVYFSGGISLPNDPPELIEFWDMGLGLEAAWGFRLSPLWEMLAAFSWQRFPADEAAQIDDLLLSGPGGTLEIESLDGRDASAMTATIEMRFHVPTEGGAVLPYLSFGWGLFSIATSDAVVTPADSGIDPVVVLGESDSALGVTIGGGLQLPVGGGTRIVLDCAYTVGFTDEISTQYLPVRLGLGFGI
jgi:hypothetical protein